MKRLYDLARQAKVLLLLLRILENHILRFSKNVTWQQKNENQFFVANRLWEKNFIFAKGKKKIKGFLFGEA